MKSSDSPPSSVTSLSLQDILSEALSLWKKCDHLAETTLLRLAILRDLLFRVHAEKSKVLSSENDQPMRELQVLEERIQELRQAQNLNQPLSQLLSEKQSSGSKKMRELPKDLDFEKAKIDAKKFQRFDRLWEKALLSEGLEIGWDFWILQASVQMQYAEKWHTDFAKLLFPKGILLFTETNPNIPFYASEDPHTLWHGRWMVLLKPDFSPSHLELQNLQGLDYLHNPPQWDKTSL